MKMDRPIIQRHVDDVSLWVVLLNVIEEAIHLLDIEAFPATHQHLAAGGIEHSSEPDLL
jgi:hypothetical protein